MAISIRPAEVHDLRAVRGLLAQLHDPPTEISCSSTTWSQILANPNRTVLLAMDREEHAVATADLLIVPNLTHGGAPWGIVENIVVDRAWRHRGLDEALMHHATRVARTAGCHTLRLASSTRPAARRRSRNAN
ncbi:MAG: GNAT family N-acetyltransferase [Actinomycetota bacterium]